MGILIDLTAKECVDRLIEVVFHEIHEESEQLGLYDIYDKFCTEIEQHLTELGENELWGQYKNLRFQESSFFDAHQAYAAGKKAKLDGEMDKNIAYKFYIAKIKSSDSYQQVKNELNAVFEEIMNILVLEKFQDKLTKVDQLYKRIYSPVEKNLWIFFNLGYDCCPA